MSDNFMMLVDREVSLADATAVSAKVIAAFRDRGLIMGELTPDCVLGGTGFRSGPAVPDLYSPHPNEGRFWELISSGVEPFIGRSFNHWSLGPACEYFICPACDQKHNRSDKQIADPIIEAVYRWLEQADDVTVLCPACGIVSQLIIWESRPPFGFGNLSFTFWNWPPFDLPEWRLDIPAMVRDITGHAIIETWGHI